LIWRFTLVLIQINYGQIGDQNGSFIQQTSILDSRTDSGNQCFFRTELIFTGFVRWTGMFGNLWLLLTHKPIRLLTCDILEVRGRYYWPGPSGLWLNSKTVDDLDMWKNIEKDTTKIVYDNKNIHTTELEDTQPVFILSYFIY
jgi:hypothetical protein